jgi:hypothetical protein
LQDFTAPVIVTKVQWKYLDDKATRSGGVAVTGSVGGYGTIKSGELQSRTADWGVHCEDCPKGGSIQFKAIDGNTFGDKAWGVEDIEVFGCLKDDSQHTHVGHASGWNHDNHNMRNGSCPTNYQDEDGDGICALCTTARDCGEGATFDGSLCSTFTDNTCTPCSKPMHAKYGTESGTLTSGTCSFVCTDGFTGDNCEHSNVCNETTVVLGDRHGDGWNGANAHVDALTGANQWTYVAAAVWGGVISGTGTGNRLESTLQTSITKAELDLGCLKDGW